MTTRILLSVSILFCFIKLQAQQFQDCQSPFTICNMGSYDISEVIGHGLIQDNLTGLNCDNNSTLKETNSYWISWVAASDGSMSFIIDPHEFDDDFDFVLYKKGISCGELQPLRCMASGDELGGELASSLPCKGATGLSFQSVDEFEKTGCKYNDDNYLKFLSAEEGEEYVLLINNFGASQGFTISFEGTAEIKSSDDCDSDLHQSVFVLENIYPNPADDLINVQYSSLLEGVSDFQLLDFQGRLIKKTKRATKQGDNLARLNVKDLPPGSYLLRINQESNSSIKQFVKG